MLLIFYCIFALTKDRRHALIFSSRSCLFLLGSWIPLGFLYFYLVWIRVSILFHYFSYMNNQLLIIIFSGDLQCATLSYILNVHLWVSFWALFSSYLVIYLLQCRTVLIVILYNKSCCVLRWDHHPVLPVLVHFRLYFRIGLLSSKETCQDFDWNYNKIYIFLWRIDTFIILFTLRFFYHF